MSESFEQKIWSAEEYLAFEEHSKIRHEYVRGAVIAMSGSSEPHNVIVGNLLALLRVRLKGSGCRVFSNDLKLRLEQANCFYYPDIMITCEPFDVTAQFKTKPILIAEVLSPSTKGTDRREKLPAYQTIPSLNYYLMVHQDRRLVELYTRAAGDKWLIRMFRKDESIELQLPPEGNFRLTLNDLYSEVEFPSRVEEDEAEYELA